MCSGVLVMPRLEALALDSMPTACHWPIGRIVHKALIREAWQHRHNVSAYDAFYPYSATYRQTFNRSCQGLASALFFSPFAMSEIGLVIAPLGPLYQLQDVFQRKGFQG